MTLLRGNSGTSTVTTGHTMDSVAITGLKGKDTLKVFYSVRQITQTSTGSFYLRNETDVFYISNMNASGLTTGQVCQGEITVRQIQNAAVHVGGMNTRTLVLTTSTIGSSDNMTTDFTGSWTLGFYSPGQTSGGTHEWSWSVYKLAGQ